MTSKMSRNGTKITFNLFADSLYRMRNFLLPLRFFSIALPLLSVSAYFNMVTVSNVPPVKKELRRNSFCRLPQKISPVQF